MGGRVSEHVRRIVERDPVLRYCLQLGIANISRTAHLVASRIAAETGVEPPLGAVKMALSRLQRELQGPSGLGRVEEVLARSALAVQERIAVVTLPLSGLREAAAVASRLAPASRFIQLVESTSAVTLMVAEEDLEEVLSSVGDPLEVLRGQAAVIVVSPRDIIETPGVVSYITSYLAGYGLNITQIVSAYVDTIIVVSGDDAPRAYSLLHDLIAGLRERSER